MPSSRIDRYIERVNNENVVIHIENEALRGENQALQRENGIIRREYQELFYTFISFVSFFLLLFFVSHTPDNTDSVGITEVGKFTYPITVCNLSGCTDFFKLK